jgi:Flp pilus assembly protein TadD
MNVRSAFFAAGPLGIIVASFGIVGCDSKQVRGETAYAEYQSASATGDLEGARAALLRLVKVEDSVADYWLALGRVQLQLGAHADAYYAFTRANELDRGNPQTLAVLTQLALLSGELTIAERHAKELSLLAPNDPAVWLAFGYVALKRQNFELAERYADQLIATLPLDPAAKLLKARVLVARRVPEEAARLLEAQLLAKPEDLSSLKALIALRTRYAEWSKVSSAAARLAEMRPKDLEYALLAIEAAFRAGQVERGKGLSLGLLLPDASSEQVSEVLQVWLDRWKAPEAVSEARRLSHQASAEQLLAYATFFNDAGSPLDTASLLGTNLRLPITTANSSINALVAASIGLRGRSTESIRVLDEILKKEADHVYALRALVNLNITAGMPRSAVTAAQRLVTISRSSVRDRLLLARAYGAMGNRRQVDRTLWDAFHDIPANRDIYEILRAHVQRYAGADGVTSVDAEFEQQQDTQLVREFF